MPSQRDSCSPSSSIVQPVQRQYRQQAQGVRSPIAEDKLLDMRWLDLSSVIEYAPRWSNKDLSKMQSCLAVTQGDVVAIFTGCRTDWAHFIGIRWHFGTMSLVSLHVRATVLIYYEVKSRVT